MNMIVSGPPWEVVIDRQADPAAPTVDQSIRGGEDLAADVQRVTDSATSTRITTAATTTLFAGRGTLKRVLVEAALTGTATIYDNTAGSSTIVTILPIGFPAGSHELGAECAVGCTIVTSAADRIVALHGK